MRMAWAGVVVLLVIGDAGASDRAARRQLEAVMQVSGTVSVDETGEVAAYTVDHREKLPAGVLQLLDQKLPTFRFEPIVHDGKPRATQARMSVVVGAKPVDAKHLAIGIRSARFTEQEAAPQDRIYIDHRGKMKFPYQALRAGVGGTVYVALRIDRGGHVVDAQVQQVNLRAVGSENQMAHWRDALSRPTLKVVREYTFHVPTDKYPNLPEFSGVLPVSYWFGNGPAAAYGAWDSYVPGPRAEIPWLAQKDAGEAIPAGTFAQAGTALQLLTPLDG